MALLMFRIVLDIFTGLFLNEFMPLEKPERRFQMFITRLPISEGVFLIFIMALENPEGHILKEFTGWRNSPSDRPRIDLLNLRNLADLPKDLRLLENITLLARNVQGGVMTGSLEKQLIFIHPKKRNQSNNTSSNRLRQSVVIGSGGIIRNIRNGGRESKENIQGMNDLFF